VELPPVNYVDVVELPVLIELLVFNVLPASIQQQEKDVNNVQTTHFHLALEHVHVQYVDQELKYHLLKLDVFHVLLVFIHLIMEYVNNAHQANIPLHQELHSVQNVIVVMKH